MGSAQGKGVGPTLANVMSIVEDIPWIADYEFSGTTTLRETREALLVELDGFPEQEALRPLVDALNAAQVQLPGPGIRPRRLFLALAEERA